MPIISDTFMATDHTLFEALTVEENKALLDLLVFSVLADEHISEVELQQFDQEIASLPFVTNDETRDEIVQHAAKTRENLENNLSDEDYIRTFLQSIADNLKGEELRRASMQMFCHIVFVDGLKEKERIRAYQVADLLEIPHQVVDRFIFALDRTEVEEQQK